jgi:hypothetical protein
MSAALTVFLLLGCFARAEAGLITYTETVTGSGSLGSQAFTDALITIRGTADTSKVQLSGSDFFVAASTQVSVASVGTGTFTDMIDVVNIQPNSLPFGDLPPGGDVAELAFVVLINATDDIDKDLLGNLNDVFATYNLQSSLGPISGLADLNKFSRYNTTAGTFEIDAVSTPGSFSATTDVSSPTPEPSSLTLALVGLLASLGCFWRHRRGGKSDSHQN